MPSSPAQPAFWPWGQQLEQKALNSGGGSPMEQEEGPTAQVAAVVAAVRLPPDQRHINRTIFIIVFFVKSS